jgi:preprotein translocase subunit SecG
MQTVLIVFHLIIVIALVGSVLLQRSEGGALGVGGGGGFMTGRGQANALTRATAILATLFFLTSLGLTLLANLNRAPKSILDTTSPAPVNNTQSVPTPGAGTVLDQLKQLQDQKSGAPAPAAPQPSAPEPPKSQ